MSPSDRAVMLEESAVQRCTAHSTEQRDRLQSELLGWGQAVAHGNLTEEDSQRSPLHHEARGEVA